MLGSRGPVPVIGPELAESVRAIVNPSGHLNLALLQDARIVLPVQAAAVPLYAETVSRAAQAAEGQAIQLVGNNTADVDQYLERLEIFPDTPGVVTLGVFVGPIPAVLPVLTGSTAWQMQRLDQVQARSGVLGTTGTLAAGTGQEIIRLFWDTSVSGGVGEVDLEGLRVGPTDMVQLLCTTLNTKVRMNLYARLAPRR